VTVITLLLWTTQDLAAQADKTASIYHVFPQIADGLLSDGSYFQTHLLVTNVNADSTTCTYNLFGLSTTRLQSANHFVLSNAGAYQFIPTTGNQANLASGYSTLSCDKPVTALVVYSYITKFGLAAFATVFSSQGATLAQLFIDQRTGSRLALALANDTASPLSYDIIVSDTSGKEAGRKTISVNSKSNIARFVDEFVSLPPAFSGAVVIHSQSGQPFNVIGLLFGGNTFTTIPATTFLR